MRLNLKSCLALGMVAAFGCGESSGDTSGTGGKTDGVGGSTHVHVAASATWKVTSLPNRNQVEEIYAVVGNQLMHDGMTLVPRTGGFKADDKSMKQTINFNVLAPKDITSATVLIPDFEDEHDSATVIANKYTDNAACWRANQVPDTVSFQRFDPTQVGCDVDKGDFVEVELNFNAADERSNQMPLGTDDELYIFVFNGYRQDDAEAAFDEFVDRSVALLESKNIEGSLVDFSGLGVGKKAEVFTHNRDKKLRVAFIYGDHVGDYSALQHSGLTNGNAFDKVLRHFNVAEPTLVFYDGQMDEIANIDGTPMLVGETLGNAKKDRFLPANSHYGQIQLVADPSFAFQRQSFGERSDVLFANDDVSRSEIHDCAILLLESAVEQQKSGAQSYNEFTKHVESELDIHLRVSR